MKWKKSWADLIRPIKSMHLATKLMLIYSVILGIAIVVFAGQLIDSANTALEHSLVNDTKSLLKESVYSIEREMDTCYQSIDSIAGDYDIISYIKDWNPQDITDVVEFSLSLKKKESLIRSLSTDVYQLRMYVHDPQFPEISSIIYSDTRLEDQETILKRTAGPTHEYWMVNQLERSYNAGARERNRTVSLFKTVTYSKNQPLGLMEVAIRTEVFFRHIFSQGSNENLVAFVVDRDGRLIYEDESAFVHKYGLANADIRSIFTERNEDAEEGEVKVTQDNISMTLIYDYISGLDSYICYVVANESVTSGIRSTRNLIVLESLGAIAISSVLIYFLTNILLKKMRLIIASMRKVEMGEINVRVDMSGSDEMSELAYHFNRMLRKLGDLINEVIAKQEAKKDAEIRMLFSQINTHFIINSLQTIGMMAEIDSHFEVADAISALGRLLRYGMKWTEGQVRLKDELEYIKNYIALMNLRHDYTVMLEVDVPDELMSCSVLKMMLQPAVENAIHYGMEPLGRGGKIRIRAHTDSETVVIEITDDGAGMSQNRLEQVRGALLYGHQLESRGNAGHGIGIKNVNERIKMVYGSPYGIDLASEKGMGAKVSIKLPAG
ncbi:MAG: sensor histidine kinase [Acetanaerobacterium sp.]